MEKIVFLLVGPRAAGKSSYGMNLLKQHSDIKGISRDEILLRLFGSEHCNPYDGTSWYAHEIMKRLIKQRLKVDADVKLILDSWTGSSEERKAIIKQLRVYGATQVVALYFTSSVEDVTAWFWGKPGIAKMQTMAENQGKGLVFYSEDAPKRDYESFHKYASNIEKDGFDEIIKVNPKEKLISLK